MFGEERRPTKVIPRASGEKAVMKLMYAALMRAPALAQRDGRVVRGQANRNASRSPTQGVRTAARVGAGTSSR
jgi:hypothetical protein